MNKKLRLGWHLAFIELYTNYQEWIDLSDEKKKLVKVEEFILCLIGFFYRN